MFGERERSLDSTVAMHLAMTRREKLVELLDRLERHLADHRTAMVLPDHGAADVVWAVLLARMEYTGMACEVTDQSALAR